MGSEYNNSMIEDYKYVSAILEYVIQSLEDYN